MDDLGVMLKKNRGSKVFLKLKETHIISKVRNDEKTYNNIISLLEDIIEKKGNIIVGFYYSFDVVNNAVSKKLEEDFLIRKYGDDVLIYGWNEEFNDLVKRKEMNQIVPFVDYKIMDLNDCKIVKLGPSEEFIFTGIKSFFEDS